MCVCACMCACLTTKPNSHPLKSIRLTRKCNKQAHLPTKPSSHPLQSITLTQKHWTGVKRRGWCCLRWCRQLVTAGLAEQEGAGAEPSWHWVVAEGSGWASQSPEGWRWWCGGKAHPQTHQNWCSHHGPCPACGTVPPAPRHSHNYQPQPQQNAAVNRRVGPCYILYIHSSLFQSCSLPLTKLCLQVQYKIHGLLQS